MNEIRLIHILIRKGYQYDPLWKTWFKLFKDDIIKEIIRFNFPPFGLTQEDFYSLTKLPYEKAENWLKRSLL